MTGEKNLDKSQVAEDRTGRTVNPIIVLQETLAGVTQIADDRMAARKAIKGVIVFMKSLPGFTPQIYAPLMNLGLALADLEDGKVSPILKPAKVAAKLSALKQGDNQHSPIGDPSQIEASDESKGGRLSDLFTRDAVKGTAGAAMEVLMKRADMPRLDAAAEVVKILSKNHIALGKSKATETTKRHTVAQWRFDATAYPQSQAGKIYAALSNPPIPSGLQPDAIKKRVLDSLDETLKEFRLTGRPPTDF